jgi:hypothetical protein
MDTPQLSERETRNDYLVAMTSIRAAKTFFIVLVLVCLLFHMGAWTAVKYGGVQAGATPAIGEDALAEAVPTAEEPSWDAKSIIQAGLPLTEFLGRASALMLCAALVLAILIALTGRLPVQGYVKGFFRALLVFALLLPWERLVGGGARIPGVFASYDSLQLDWQVPGMPAVSPAAAVVRFIAYPLVVVIILLLANQQFRRSYREAESRHSAEIAMRVV